MEPRVDPSNRLLLRASQQAGVISTRQAAALGFGRHSIARLVRSGDWQRMAPGLLFTSRGRPPWLASAWGGVLLGGNDARLGAEAAGHLHGLIDTPPRQLVVWTHGAHRDREPWRFKRHHGTYRRRGGERPPMISVEDCVLDLSRGLSEARVIALVTRAVQQRLTDPELLRRRMAERLSVSHHRLLLDLLHDVGEGSESPLELRYLRAVERAHGLPEGRRQLRDGRSGHHRDVWYVAFRTVVELDGRLGHEGEGRFRDMNLDNLAVLDGLTTLRFGWHDVTIRPCRLARMVGMVLNRHGWTGSLRTCRRCHDRV